MLNEDDTTVVANESAKEGSLLPQLGGKIPIIPIMPIIHWVRTLRTATTYQN